MVGLSAYMYFPMQFDVLANQCYKDPTMDS